MNLIDVVQIYQPRSHSALKNNKQGTKTENYASSSINSAVDSTHSAKHSQNMSATRKKIRTQRSSFHKQRSKQPRFVLFFLPPWSK